jgi:energy-coupling factor transporter ATP-binding protein EcfA2
MLRKLSISNYAIIDHLELEFSDKLTVITGETGAGKSIAIEALSLVLGDRAEAAVLYDKQKKCIVEAAFAGISDDVKQYLTMNDLDIEELLMLRRELSPTGKSRANERIECSILINVTQELSSDKFSAQLTVQSNRPVFNSSFNSTVLKWVDKDFQFQYAEYQPLEFNENTLLSNLTSILAYYAYTIIGLDNDSFAPSGGTPYYQKAQTIVNAAQSTPESGWKSYDGTRNRYWLINNLLNTKLNNVRTVLYKYHRDGLDKMYENADLARKPITECLNLLNQMNDDVPNSMILQVFMQGKQEELMGIFSKATPQEKTAAVQTLSKLDPANSSKYQLIMSSN